MSKIKYPYKLSFNITYEMNDNINKMCRGNLGKAEFLRRVIADGFRQNKGWDKDEIEHIRARFREETWKG